jgi:hypothetical protein
MKCVITGHTTGIGKAIYDHFLTLGWEVIGLSRTTGFTIPNDLDKIIEVSTDCDLFINSSYAGGNQDILVQALSNKVKKMIVLGSIARFEPFNVLIPEYATAKQKVAEACRLVSITNSDMPLLHMDIAFIEGSTPNLADPDPTNFVGDFVIEYQEILSAIDFWLSNTKIRQIEFRWKLSPILYYQLRRLDNKSEILNNLYNSVK